MERNPTIAHVSDLHFDRTSRWNLPKRFIRWVFHRSPQNHNHDAANALASDLLQIKPDFILVTGDLSETGKQDELRGASRYLHKLLHDLAVKSQRPARFIVVPGNHDMGSIAARYWRLLTGQRLALWSSVFPQSSAPSIPNLPDRLKPASLHEYYLKTLHNGNRSPETSLSTDDLDAEAAKLTRHAHALCEYYPAYQVAFLKFDSNSFTLWPWHLAHGNVGTNQLHDSQRILSDHEAAFPDFRDSRRIALLHHHIQYLPNTGSDTLYLLKDAGNFWRTMLEMKVTLVLHGHKHYATHVGLKYITDDYQERELLTISAGSVTSRDLPTGELNSYYHITLGHFHCDFQKRQFRTASFSPSGGSKKRFFQIRNLQLTPTPAPVRAIDLHALSLMLSPEDDEIDYKHEITLIQYQAEIDAARNFIGQATLQGINRGDDASSFLIVSVVGTGALTFEDLQLNAYDNTTSPPEPLPPPCPFGPSADPRKFKIRLSLKNHVTPNAPFSISYRFVLPKAMYPQNDYDAFTLTQFSRGVGELRYSIKSEYEFVEPQFYTLYRTRARLWAGTSFHEWDAKEGKDSFKITLSSPNALGYVFHYLRLEKKPAMSISPQ